MTTYSVVRGRVGARVKLRPQVTFRIKVRAGVTCRPRQLYRARVRAEVRISVKA